MLPIGKLKLTASQKRLVIMGAAVVIMALLLILLTIDYSSCSACGTDA